MPQRAAAWPPYDVNHPRPQFLTPRACGTSSSVVPSRAEVVQEGDGWSVFISGLPIAADGATFDEAISEMVDALREYAQDWQDRLLNAPNHRDNWGLVQLISLSDDDQLRRWLVGPAR